MPKASIIVPIYNVYDYLDKCLDSLVNQTEKDIEIICVNDGSTDNSQEIINKYSSLDERVTSLIKENGGLSDARNHGLVHAESEYVMFIDSDDFCELDMVEECLKALEDHQADMVVFDVNEYFSKTDVRKTNNLPFDQDKIYSLKNNPEILAFCNNAAWNKMYKKSLFTDNDILYPFGYRHQDLGTTPLLILKCEKVIFLNKPLYNYLADRTNNLTTTYDKKIYHICDMVKHVCDYYKYVNEFENYYEELKYLSTINTLYSLKKVRFYTDRDFVFKFIDDAFELLERYFPDYKKFKYNPLHEKVDKLYFNKNLLKMYVTYNLIKKKVGK